MMLEFKVYPDEKRPVSVTRTGNGTIGWIEIERKEFVPLYGATRLQINELREIADKIDDLTGMCHDHLEDSSEPEY